MQARALKCKCMYTCVCVQAFTHTYIHGMTGTYSNMHARIRSYEMHCKMYTCMHTHRYKDRGIHVYRRIFLHLSGIRVFRCIANVGLLTAGIYAGSLAVLTDAAHLLTDVASFLVALIAAILAEMPGSKNYTFGGRTSTVASSHYTCTCCRNGEGRSSGSINLCCNDMGANNCVVLRSVH
jgi:hypothetical protein